MTAAVLLVFPEAGSLQATKTSLPAATEVMKIQLDALQNNQRWGEDRGIAIVWEHAHPENQAVTGPPARFAAMLKSRSYSMLLDHRTHSFKLIDRKQTQALFAVKVEARNGKKYGFAWILSRIQKGDRRGAWATSDVSTALVLGEEI